MEGSVAGERWEAQRVGLMLRYATLRYAALHLLI